MQNLITILGGIGVYCVISMLAFFMTSSLHFVLLGILVAMVQGGTQGLSRSLTSSKRPWPNGPRREGHHPSRDGSLTTQVCFEPSSSKRPCPCRAEKQQ